MSTLRHRVRLITVGGAISYRALFNWTRPAMFVSALLAVPVLQLLFFAYLGRGLGVADDRFFVIGNAVLCTSFPCVYGGTMAVANERGYGTLGALLLSPASRPALWAGRMLPYVLNGLLVAVFTLVAGALMFHLELSPGALLALLPVLVAASASCAALGMALGAVGLRLRDVFTVSNLGVLLLLLLTGANVPRSVLPAWMRAVGDVIPVTHAVAAARGVASGLPFADVAPELAAEALTGIGLLAAAVVLLRYFEYAGRRRGNLDSV